MIGTDGVTEVGAIYKRYRGFLSEAFSSADAFLLKSEDIDHQTRSINEILFSCIVPMDLDIKVKALTLSALFLIVGFILNISKY